MSNNKELLTVKEFSEIVGVTSQAVYKQLNNRLLNYVVSVGNRKMLKKQALKLYNIELVEKSWQPKPTEEPTEKEQLEAENQQLIELLKQELEEKNEQIRTLQRLLDQQQKLALTDKKFDRQQSQNDVQTVETAADLGEPDPPERSRKKSKPSDRSKGNRSRTRRGLFSDFWRRKTVL